jgi:1-acyl-sn-glycerol-3-phosphate acyltransferase
MIRDMPPVKSRPLYVYRIFAKSLSFFVFGLATLLLVFPVMPAMLLFFHPAEKFQKYTRRTVSAFFRFFISMMRIIGCAELDAPDREVFNQLKSKIVAANHPSLLDVVMLISLIPNADVIVRGSLSRNIICRGVVSKLYILNSLDFDEIVSAAKESLNRGNCIVIFPEGTRTPRNGQMRLKKGASRLSLLTGTEIVAAHIGGTDKYGLGKKDPFLSFNHTDKYIYRVRIQKRLSPEKYSGMEIQCAVRRLNAEMLELFQRPVNI